MVALFYSIAYLKYLKFLAACILNRYCSLFIEPEFKMTFEQYAYNYCYTEITIVKPYIDCCDKSAVGHGQKAKPGRTLVLCKQR